MDEFEADVPSHLRVPSSRKLLRNECSLVNGFMLVVAGALEYCPERMADFCMYNPHVRTLVVGSLKFSVGASVKSRKSFAQFPAPSLTSRYFEISNICLRSYSAALGISPKS